MTDNGHAEPLSEEEFQRILSEQQDWAKRMLVKALGSIYDSLAVILVDMPGVFLGCARADAKGNPDRIMLSVPAQVVKNLKGDPAERDFLCLVHIPRSTQKILEGADQALIVLPDGAKF